VPGHPVGWEALRDEVAVTLAGLADGEFLILGLPVTAVVPRRRWRRPSAAGSAYVQFYRFETTLLGECSGAASFGGPVELTPEQDRALRSLGWHHPDDVPAWGRTPYATTAAGGRRCLPTARPPRPTPA